MDAGWFSFFNKIKGYNVEVTQQFSCKFIGSYVDFKSLSFEVSEASIAVAVGFSIEGNQWFKKFPFEVNLNMFLLLGHEGLDWGKGTHQKLLKEEWGEVFSIV